ncbi:MAG: hypothetical protein HY682_06065, partial [Chloroflexi bacterium]|nr:hypothetical protein [Chloroflexota bacterium]
MDHRWLRRGLIGGALAVVAGAAIACGSGGVPQSAYDASQAQLKDKEAQLVAAQTTLSAKDADLKAKEGELKKKADELQVVQKQLAGMAPSTVVQVGQLQPAPVGAQPSGWDTPESIRGGLTLFARYDSSGPDAYDVAKHPLVYASSEGMAKAGSPGTNKFAGLYIMDANTKEIVASANFDLGYEHTGAGHTVGIAPDGKWFYIGTTVTIDKKSTPLVLIVNARTLKLDKALKGTGISDGFALHHSIGFVDSKGNDRVTLTKNSGPGFILDPKNDNRVVRSITAQDVAMLGHNYVTVDPTGKFLYWALRPGSWGNPEGQGGLAKVNLETGAVTYIWGLGEGANPLGMAHTADGKFT